MQGEDKYAFGFQKLKSHITRVEGRTALLEAVTLAVTVVPTVSYPRKQQCHSKTYDKKSTISPQAYSRSSSYMSLTTRESCSCRLSRIETYTVAEKELI